jgi:hypothetical protein
MEPITLIVTALVAGIAAAAKPVAEEAVKDAYHGLKALIVRKFGDKGDVVLAVDQVEKKPDSSGRQETLAEELAGAGVGQDAEVLQAAQKLLALLQPQTVDSSQTATADGGSAAATGGGPASVGDHNVTIGGTIQGGVHIYQGGAPGTAGGPAAAVPVDTGGYDLDAVRELLLNGFTATAFRRLFLYTSNPQLRPLVREFGDADGLATMIDKAIQVCLAGGLLPDLLREVERGNPRMWARYAGLLRS